jgi:mRNA-degrading endonuclease RelE of RelBE toxin-antitoxin system
VSEVVVKQMPLFKKAYKKLHMNQKKAVDDAIREIIKDPGIGEEKKDDLTHVFVYKFKVHNQEILLAYEWVPKERTLLALGVNENFYRDLKRSL